MNVLFLADYHDAGLVQRILERTDSTIALVLHGGDFASYTTAELAEPLIQAVSAEKIADFAAAVPRTAHFVGVPGNHDFFDPTRPRKVALSTLSAIFPSNWHLLLCAGSHSVQIAPKGDAPYEIDENFWEGYPHGPLLADAHCMPEMQALFEAEICEIATTGRLARKRLTDAMLALGASQYDDLRSLVRPGEMYIVLTHYGPYFSQTSLYTVNGCRCSSGSFGVQRFLDEFGPQVAAVLHGHTHNPDSRVEKHYSTLIVNPGAAKNGNFAVIRFFDVTAGTCIIKADFHTITGAE